MNSLGKGVFLFLLGCLAGWGGGLFFRGDPAVSNEAATNSGGAQSASTLVANGQTQLGKLGDLETELDNAAKAMFDVDTDQRRRLDLNDRVAAVAEREGFEATVLFIVGKEYASTEESTLLHAVFTKWAEIDGMAAADYAASLSARRKENLVGSVLTKWAVAAPEDVIKWLSTREKGEFRPYLLTRVFNVIAKKAPQDAMRLLSQYPDVFRGSQYSSFESTIATSLADEDLETAIAFAESISTKHDRQSALSQIAGKWVNKDPDAAWEWAGSLKKGDERINIFTVLLQTIGGNNPEEAVSRFESLEDDGLKTSIEYAVVRALELDDPETALRYAEANFPEPRKTMHKATVLRNLVSTNPNKAFSIAHESFPLGPERQRVLSSALNQIVRSDFDEAVAMLDSVEPEGSRAELSSSLVYHMIQTSPEKAREWIEQLPDGEMRKRAVGELASSLAENSPMDGINYALNQSEWENGQHPALSNALGIWAKSEPSETVSWVLENTPEEFQERFIPTMMSRWSKAELPTVRAWIDDLPEGNLRNRSIGAFTTVLANHDVTMAAEWLDTLPSGRGKDNGITRFVSEVDDIDPAAAVIWAGQIQDEDDRDRALRNAATNWARKDRAGAENWLRRNSFSDEWIQKIMDRVQ